MTTITRHVLNFGINEQTEIELPEFAYALFVHADGGEICMWVKGNTAQQPVKRYFAVVGTGWDLDDRQVVGKSRMYIGTVFIASREWHVFEVEPR